MNYILCISIKEDNNIPHIISLLSIFILFTTNPIVLRLSEPDVLVRLPTRMGTGANESYSLLKEGFNSLDFLLETYYYMENLQKFLKNLNKKFISVTRTSDNSYFPTIIMRFLCGVHWFKNIMVSGISQVPDIDFFDTNIMNGCANEYETWLSIRDRLENIDVKIPKCIQDNWTPFKGRFIYLCELTVGSRSTPRLHTIQR